MFSTRSHLVSSCALFVPLKAAIQANLVHYLLFHLVKSSADVQMISCGT